MPTIYSYVVTEDLGVAPNVDGGICTLALCKPNIRKQAQVGDWIVGLCPKRIGQYNVSFVMIVDRVLSFRDYWECGQFDHKKPHQSKTPDNIYQPDSSSISGYKKKDSWVHCEFQHIDKDISGKYVLIANIFWYFGIQHKTLPRKFQDLDLPGYRRGHKKMQWKSNKIVSFRKWLDAHGQGVLGCPRDQEKVQKYLSCRV